MSNGISSEFVVLTLALIVMISAACSGSGGAVRPGGSLHQEMIHEIHRPNPWHGHMVPPIPIGPPPIIIPEPPLIQVPLPSGF